MRMATLMLLAMTSCTASLELDRFKKAEATSVDSAVAISYFDVRFSAKAMTSHLNERLEIRVVDKDNRVQAKAVYENITKPDFSLYMRRIIPKANAPHRLDFWADHNSTTTYDGIEGGINEKDHAWRRVLADPLPEDMRLTQGTYELEFLHDTAFVDIATDLQGNKIPFADTLLPFTLNVVGAGAFGGKPIDIRIVDKASGRLVGLHRNGLSTDSYAARVPGILDEETRYEVSVHVDADQDGKYSPGDPSWLLDLISGSTALVTTLDVGTTPRTEIQTGEP